MQIFDLIIIGGGPIGLACGVEAKKAGLNYVILEKGTLT
ncbi:MAG: thioredoxin reductase (NADPH), partial [Planctomycetota bacterium]